MAAHPSSSSETSRELVPPKQSLFASLATLLFGVAILAAVARSAIQSDPSDFRDWWGVGLSAAFGALVLRVGFVMRAPKGGLRVEGRHLLVGGSNHLDTLRVPLLGSRVEVRRRPRDAAPAAEESAGESGEDAPSEPRELVSVELVLPHGGSVVLGESTDWEESQQFAEQIRADLQLTSEAGGPVGPAEGGPLQWRVGPGWALATVVLLFGITCVGLGALLFAHVEANPLSGFLFGPPLTLLGLLLLGLWVARSSSSERLSIEEGALRHEVQWAGFRLRSTTVPLSQPAWARVRPRGANGWLVEAVVGGAVIPMAAGATSSTRAMGPEDVLDLSRRVNSLLR